MSHAVAFRIRKPKRRWFQFSLRTYLVLLTVFSVWFGLHVRSAVRQKEAVAAIKAYGGWVYYDFQKYGRRAGDFYPEPESWVPEWILSRAGVDLFHDVDAVNLVSNNEGINRFRNSNTAPDALRYLEAFPELRTLYLHKTQGTDHEMKYIGGLAKLEYLWFDDASQITDLGVSHLKKLNNLMHLTLDSSHLTDDSLATFGGLTRLEQLSIQGSYFTDEGLAHLQGMVRLERLGLQGNHFTDKGLAYLRDMTQLKSLWLGNGDNQITDEGLIYLNGLINLEELDLQRTRVTAKGLEQLTGLKNLKRLWLFMKVGDLTQVKKALPNCKIR